MAVVCLLGISCATPQIVQLDQPSLNDSGSRGSTAAVPGARVFDRVVAIVGSKAILDSEIMRKAMVGYRSTPGAPSLDTEAGKQLLAETKKQVLHQAINDELLLQQENDPLLANYLQQFPLPPYEEVIRQNRERYKKAANITDEQFVEMIRQSGMTESEVDQRFYDQTRRDRILGIMIGSRIQVTESEVKEAYEQMVKKAGTEGLEAHLLHILVPVSANATEDARKQKQTVAEAILGKLRAGQSFEVVAKQYTSEQVPSETDLGFIAVSDLPEAVKEATLSMKIQEIRGPFLSEKGFHIVRLLEKRNKDIKPFDEVKETLKNQIAEKRYQEDAIPSYLSQLRRKTHIELRL